MAKSKVLKMVGVLVTLIGVIIACIATVITPFFKYDSGLKRVADDLGVAMSGKLLDHQNGSVMVGMFVGIAAIGLIAALLGKMVVTIMFGIIEVAFSIYYSSFMTEALAEYSKWVSNGSGVTLVMVAGIVIAIGGIIGLIGNIMKKSEN